MEISWQCPWWYCDIVIAGQTKPPLTLLGLQLLGFRCTWNVHTHWPHSMHKQCCLQVTIFMEKDKCVDRLHRKTTTQVINYYAGHVERVWDPEEEGTGDVPRPWPAVLGANMTGQTAGMGELWSTNVVSPFASVDCGVQLQTPQSALWSWLRRTCTVIHHLHL